MSRPKLPVMRLALGDRTYDVTTRALVMGILNRTPDSFYDRGATWDFDEFLRRAERIVADGADILDVGGVKAGPGPHVTEQEELDRVIPAIEALRERFDVPLSVDTTRAAVAAAGYAAGAVVGNDISGFADPDYLAVSAAAGATVVATHIRLAPRVPDPDPHYDDVVAEVRDFLVERARRAEAAGIPPERIVVDAGLDLGKTRGPVPDAAAGVGAARLSRVPAAAVGVQQDVPRHDARPRDHRARRRVDVRHRPRRGARLPDRQGPRRAGHPPGVPTRSPPSSRPEA